VMGKEFDHINDARSFIVDKLSDDSLLGRNGYLLRQNLYIIDYKPEQEQYAKDLIKQICETDLPAHSVTPLVINLYDIVLNTLDEQGLWEPLVEVEAETDRNDLIMMLQDTVSVNDVIAPTVNQQIAENPDADIVFITGVGETYPYIRTHTLLQEISSTVPVVLVFPGHFEQRADGSTSLNILDLEQGTTGGYYRATRVFDL
jgi:hypothetical protein